MNNPKIRFTIKGLGKMEAELYPEKAPKTVENFLKLCNEGFFEGLIFHRVIQGFMIQGGGFDTSMKQKPAKPIVGEFKANGFAQNDLHHDRGVLSMARTNDPNSASSQFFIMHAEAGYLDGQYAAFGELTSGFDVLDAVANTRTHSVGWYDDVPKEAIVIEKVEVIA